MNIVIVSEMHGVKVFKKWSDVQSQTSFTKEQFTQVGGDYILTTDGESYEIAQDIKLLERVASERVFQKSKFEITDWMILGTFLFSLLIYFKL